MNNLYFRRGSVANGRRIFLAVLLTSLSSPILAQQPATLTGSPPMGTYPQLQEFLKRAIDAKSGGVAPMWLLSPEGLRGCLTMAYDLDVSNARIIAERARIASEERRLEAEAVQLQARSNQPFDTADEANEHDQRVSENQRQRNDLVPATAAFNSLIQRYNLTTSQFSDTCSGKHFYKSDLQNIAGSLPFSLGSVQ